MNIWLPDLSTEVVVRHADILLKLSPLLVVSRNYALVHHMVLFELAASQSRHRHNILIIQADTWCKVTVKKGISQTCSYN